MIVKVTFSLFLALVLLTTFGLAEDRPIAATATETKPLEKGQKIPEANLTGLDGEKVALASLHRDQPLVIVFFRGGWCPICTKHTQELIGVYPEIKAKGFEIIGVSPDSVERSKSNSAKNVLPFPIYSDSSLDAIGKFGLAFKVDDATVTKYKGFGIDLEQASGQDHHALPIPAIYVVGTDGVITFAHSNPDYRQRLDAKELVQRLAN
jgi:peroxiredoxin